MFIHNAQPVKASPSLHLMPSSSGLDIYRSSDLIMIDYSRWWVNLTHPYILQVTYYFHSNIIMCNF